TRDRLSTLIPAAPESWVLRVREDASSVVSALRTCTKQLVSELDKIDGLAAYRAHRWFDRFRPNQANAQVLYLLGDRAGAWREVQDLAALFADRQNANRAEWWVERLRLSGLGPAEPLYGLVCQPAHREIGKKSPSSEAMKPDGG